ncbi:colicin V production CvpA [Gammaproteobacteria bacterium 45_16_T64]|nr:colicin V production CvpA [Gammaproteobacteria bacterium 45_16_T64]
MTLIDYIILGVVAVSSLLSLRKGFSNEALSLVTWVSAYVVAKLFSSPLAVLFVEFIDPPSARQPAAFATLFILTLIIGALIKVLFKELISASGLSATDRVLGMVFGAARGLIIVVFVLSMLSRMTDLPQDPWWKESMAIPHLLMVEEWTHEMGRLAWQKVMDLSGS